MLVGDETWDSEKNNRGQIAPLFPHKLGLPGSSFFSSFLLELLEHRTQQPLVKLKLLREGFLSGLATEHLERTAGKIMGAGLPEENHELYGLITQQW